MRDIDTLQERFRPLGPPLTPEQIKQARQRDQPRSDAEPAGAEWDEWDGWLVGEEC